MTASDTIVVNRQKYFTSRPYLSALTIFVLCASPMSAGLGQQQGGNTDGTKLETLEASKFSNSTKITNKWMPMKPGTRWIYEGTTVEDDGKIVPHRVEITVTDLVKVVGGVRAVVSYDLDYSDNELVEAELAFFAQDDDGTVWHLGQYPEEYEDGNITLAPAWIHGYEGGRAGIVMKAKPQLGEPSYSQGWGPKVDWTDRGTTHQMGQKISVPTGSYEDVLVIKETARDEKDAAQLKYYAPGVGNIKVGWMGSGEKTKEVLELIKMEQLDAKALADIRAKVLKLETSAYQHSKDAYAHTAPATALPGATVR